MARPTKYTPDTEQRLLEAIQLGATYVLAAQYAGIHYDTLREWMHSKPALSLAIKEAEGKAAVVWLAKIERAATDGNWQAAAWKLERLYPHMYGRTVKEHTGETRLIVEYRRNWRRQVGSDTDAELEAERRAEEAERAMLARQQQAPAPAAFLPMVEAEPVRVLPAPPPPAVKPQPVKPTVRDVRMIEAELANLKARQRNAALLAGMPSEKTSQAPAQNGYAPHWTSKTL